MDVYLRLDPKIPADALGAQTLARPFYDPNKLGLAGTQGHHLLRARPMLQEVGTPNYASAGRASA
eukprot:1743005-Lingulodinium_polyedra.AAC.1